MGSTTVRLADMKLAATEDTDGPQPKVRLPLLSSYLDAQQDLSAVERFSQHHDETDAGAGPLQERFYRDLLPAQPPAPGQQYAFQVDLDACSGCKACVTACHSLNGLDESETWRSVGVLHGGSDAAPLQKTVTTACHHCLEPGCLQGCPVEAYEKDPTTGIVRHLDDQCIGCQYCVFTCPYEVPQFNKDMGIVRKCDMCSDRLAEGEAPACVQACPNEAISIQVVDAAAVVADAQTDAFLPGAPSPGITLPTTTYKSAEPLPRNMLPADFFTVRPAHQHMPLVVMLVLTQLSAGAFLLDRLLPLGLSKDLLDLVRPWHGSFALALGLLALGASTSHLGRPQYAFRAIIGLRTSWLSREILAFGAFAGIASAYAGAQLAQAGVIPIELPPQLTNGLGTGAAAVGILGVFCSVMLYAVTRRTFWSFGRTAGRFFGTALLLGLATTLASVFTPLAGVQQLPSEAIEFARVAAMTIAALTGAKLVHEASVLLHLSDLQYGDLKRSAVLLTRELRTISAVRLALATVGGVLLPLAWLTRLTAADSVSALVVSAICLALLTAGEVIERMTFFAAMASPRMPGGLR